MVDMEPAQQDRLSGFEARSKIERLTTDGMFPPYKNTTKMSQS